MPEQILHHLQELAAAIGFDTLSVAPLGALTPVARHAYQRYVKKGMQGEMAYLADHAAVREDPQTRWAWAKSVIVLGIHYDSNTPPTEAHQRGRPDNRPPRPVDMIARYARGRDYHRAIQRALKLFSHAICAAASIDIQKTYYNCDTGPILERPWADLSGLGWQARNGLVIRPGHGSFLFLAELLVDSVLPYGTPATDHCGTCRRCIDACPTDAIVDDRVVDSRKCIAYLNIEKRTALSHRQQEMLNGWLFGCDICQNVCPHNFNIGKTARDMPALSAERMQILRGIKEGEPVDLDWLPPLDPPVRKILSPALWQTRPQLEQLTWHQAVHLSRDDWDILSRGSALRRIPYERFVDNAGICARYWKIDASLE